HESLHARETIGVDRSARMLETATSEPLPDGLRFELGTVESYPLDGQFDLVFSNAVYHWIEDHETLIPSLVKALKPAAQPAFQMPAMQRHPSHRVAARLAGETFRQALDGWKRPQPVHEPEDYAQLLFRAGIEQPQVRLEIYPHVLDRREDVVEWMKGALLTE